MLTTINGWHALALVAIAFGIPIVMAAVGDYRSRRKTVPVQDFGPDVDALHRDAIQATFRKGAPS